MRYFWARLSKLLFTFSRERFEEEEMFWNKIFPYISIFTLWDHFSVFGKQFKAWLSKLLFICPEEFFEKLCFNNKTFLFVIFFVLWVRMFFNFCKIGARLPNLPSMFPLKFLRNMRRFRKIILRPMTTSKIWA